MARIPCTTPPARLAYILLGSLIFVALLHPRVEARTWTVEKDGCGDFTVIQDAVDAAAPGDTVLVRSGRYTEVAPFVTPGWTYPTYVAVEVDSLTILGEDRESVIIGPETPDFQGFGPKGIATQLGLTYLRVQDLTLTNVREGVHSTASVDVRNCSFEGCYFGVFAAVEDAINVSECTFVGGDSGLMLFLPSQIAEIESCHFSDASAGVLLIGIPDANVRSCTFAQLTLGVQYERDSVGTIERCHFSDIENTNVNVISRSRTHLTHNRLRTSYATLSIGSDGHVTGTENILEAGAGYTIDLFGEAGAEMHGNHILFGDGDAVVLDNGGYISEPPAIIDFTDNYWGTDDAAAVADAIWDGNDNPDIRGFVLFEPLEASPIATDQRSWSELKALYGGQN